MHATIALEVIAGGQVGRHPTGSNESRTEGAAALRQTTPVPQGDDLDRYSSLRAAETDATIEEVVDSLFARLQEQACVSVGFPGAADLDLQRLAPFLSVMLNNLGDPSTAGTYPLHTKDFETEAVDVLADLLGAPADNRWGYVTSGGTEANEYALWQARSRYPDALVYHSVATHHCFSGVLDRLGMRSVSVGVDGHGEVDYTDLADQLQRHRNRPAVLVANAGTGMTEAVDDVCRIVSVLDEQVIHRRWIHVDGALAGIPLALLDSVDRPGVGFEAGADSIAVSGHKFLGSPIPYAVVVVLDSLRAHPDRDATYTGVPDTTVSNSRSGLAALICWYTLRRHGLDGLRRRAERCRELAAYACRRLDEICWPAKRSQPYAFTVTFPTPPQSVVDTWHLPSVGGLSHLICMPGVSRAQVDALVHDVAVAIAAPYAPTDGQP